MILVKKLCFSLSGFLLGLTVALLLTLVVGENPYNILMILIKSAFGSSYDLGLTLFYTTALIFTGLSVAIAFKGGLFNIGAEGQLSMAALGCIAFAYWFPQMSWPISLLLITVFGMISAMAWALIPALLKAYRSSHEVIVTMMLNFVAAGLCNYFIVHQFANPTSQNPESFILGEHFRPQNIDFINPLFADSPVNIFLLLAIFAAIMMHIFMKNTVLGYEIKVSGQNQQAADRAGINSKKMMIVAMLLSGLFASGAGLNEVIGFSGQFKLGFSPELGFVGIAVALMANNNPLGIIASAFLMACLHKGSLDLDFETQTITKDFSKIIQGTIILGIGIQYYIQNKLRTKKL